MSAATSGSSAVRARVGIDAHYLGLRHSGNETYVRNLIKALAATDGRNDYSVYVASKDVMAHPPVVGDNIDYRYIQSNPLVRVPFGFPMELHRRPVDLLQVHYNAPLVVESKLLLVMHDISWALHPHLFPYFKGRQIALRARPAVRKAERVVVASTAIRDEVITYYDLPPERVAVVPLGVDERFGPRDHGAARERLERAYGIDRDFVLYVGDLQPRKNLPRLVEAFARLKAAGAPHALVIVGKKAWDYDAIFEAVEKHGLAEDVIFTGYVPDEDLPDLYSAAELFVYPSIYEGFGFPPLEAMACGTPVVASDEPTIGETVGGAARLFDPHDTTSIADAMETALSDADLRVTLRERGSAHAASLTWTACATQMLALYDEILGVA